MDERRLPSLYDEQSLVPLVGNSELLDIVNGEVVVIDKIPTPTKLGIPQPLELIRDTLGTLATTHM